VIGSSLFYRRLSSPLHATRAGVGAVWSLSLIGAAVILYHPLALLALALGVLAAARGAGVGAALMRSLRTATIVAVPIVLVNVLVSRQGLTVFARLGDLGPFGRGDLTVESLVYGAVIALKVTLTILVSALASLTVDPDQLLRGMRRLSFRSALTATLATRMLPVLAADSQRIADAQRTRPHGSARGTRGRVALLSAVIGGSLDRAMDVAATLEVRGYAAARGPAARGARRADPRLAFSRHDLAFAASAAAILALAVVGRVSGVAAFESYPRIEMRLDVGTIVLCAGLLTAIVLPFCDRRGIDR
jgi:energy-coupling factor transport system permease protein